MGKKLTKEQFVSRAQGVHSDKYNYSQSDYVNLNKKIKILCNFPKHNPFYLTPAQHFNGKGCPICDNAKKHGEDFIKKAKNLHWGYDYSKVTYVNRSTKVKIICPKHGVFEETPANYLSSRRCPNCKKEAVLSKWRNKQEQDVDKLLLPAKGQQIYTTIQHGQKIKISYDGGSTPGSERFITPVKIFFKNNYNSFYVKAYCHKTDKTKTFRLGLINILGNTPSDQSTDNHQFPNSKNNGGGCLSTIFFVTTCIIYCINFP